MKKTMPLLLLLAFILSAASGAFALRTILVLQVERGQGASTDEVTQLMDRVETVLKNQGLFTVSSRAALNVLVQKMGGCQNQECFYSAAKEVGIQLLVTGNLRKQRDEYIITLNIIDTEFGEPVMELSEALPRGATEASEAWLGTFLAQLEPLTVGAEEVTAAEPAAAAGGEAATATIIMEDELSGKLAKDKSPYLIVKSVVVPANQTLEIEPGVTVLMGGEYVSIVVFGQVMANGTEQDPVVFKSARKEPKLWDWDRIYVRGATRSYFTHCRISHSNFGIHADNGNVTLANCKFVSNSISCVYASQSNVQIKDTEIGKGHIVGLNVDAGSEVTVDSGSIMNNNRAVVCHPYARLKMSRTRIENNDVGIAASSRADVKLTDVMVRDNRVGVLSQKDVKSGRLFMVSGNDENLKVGSEAEFKTLLTVPERITVVRTKERALADTSLFQADFSSLPSRGESMAARLGLLGQVSAGLSFRSVDDLNGDVHTNTAKADLPHQTTYVPGLRPEFQIFMQSKVGDRESNLTLNGYSNYYSDRIQAKKGDSYLTNQESYRNISKIEVVNLTTKMRNQEIVLGDFSQDKSELSISSRQVRGLRYERDIKTGPERKVRATVLAGQSSVPYPVGLKPDMLDSSTTPERQEWLGMADAVMDLTGDLQITAHVIGTRHVDDPLLFPGLTMDSTDLYGADPKLKSVAWGGGARMALSDMFSVYAEVDAGYADTLSYNVDSSETVGRGYSADTAISHPLGQDNVAGLIGVDYAVRGVTGNLQYIRAQNQFFTGGNPSIKPAVGNMNKARLTAARTFEMDLLKGRIKSLDLQAGLDWEAVGTDETGITPDLLGADALSLSTAEEYDSLEALYEDFKYKPVENKFKGGLGIKLPVGDFSVEPDFSYYYETKTLLKRDAKSKEMSVEVSGISHTVIATEYTDAESRTSVGGAVVYMPALPENPWVSNVRTKLGLTTILTDDMNGKSSGDPDSSYWGRNTGTQLKVDGSLSAKFLKSRFSNTVSGSYRTKDKDYRDEVKVTQKVSDKFAFKIIPRKLTLNLMGYYAMTTTDYKEAVKDEETGLVLKYNGVSEELTVYGGEGQLVYALNNTVSITGKGGYENGLDTSESGSENYETIFVAALINYLF